MCLGGGPGRTRPVQRRDRRRHGAQPRHGQDPRQPRDDQARRPTGRGSWSSPYRTGLVTPARRPHRWCRGRRSRGQGHRGGLRRPRVDIELHALDVLQQKRSGVPSPEADHPLAHPDERTIRVVLDRLDPRALARTLLGPPRRSPASCASRPRCPAGWRGLDRSATPLAATAADADQRPAVILSPAAGRSGRPDNPSARRRLVARLAPPPPRAGAGIRRR